MPPDAALGTVRICSRSSKKRTCGWWSIRIASDNSEERRSGGADGGEEAGDLHAEMFGLP
ncbi:hypothetical protein GCM10008965_01230 [Methylorubrum aminovorans]|nr:hypothetical protein GCM10025880_25800 [Methylorubrum aminovorans]